MNSASRSVGIWLLSVAAIILAMVTIGGLTRITGSGLSITEWEPLMGAIPPLNEAQWAEAFAKYQRIPQYKIENLGMSLAAFQGIFWWEWTHRLLGRLLGVVFFVPFVWFAWKGAIRRTEWPRFVVLFALGGLQGFIGWWMVQSGLETRVSVSQYRLAIHLGAALLLLIAILWFALDYLRGGKSTGVSRRATGFAGLVYVQMLLGALVAGLHAGLVYNTWPDMNGRLFPEGAFFQAPWWINFFENDGLAQFDHRTGAYVVAACAVWVWAKARALNGWVRTSANLILGITAFQIVLGITTLLLQAPEGLAALHQVTAAALLCAAVWHAYEMRIYPSVAQVSKMNISEAQAFWVLGLLPREKIPLLAQDALEKGLDDPSLRILAGLLPGEIDEADAQFEKTLTSMGYGKLEKADALQICIKVISLQIVKGEIDPHGGARLIWKAAHRVEGTHEADPFIYAASEYEDRPKDRKFFASEITKEAKRRLGN